MAAFAHPAGCSSVRERVHIGHKRKRRRLSHFQLPSVMHQCTGGHRHRSAVVEAIPIPAPSRTAWSVRRNCHTPECTLRPAASGCLS